MRSARASPVGRGGSGGDGGGSGVERTTGGSAPSGPGGDRGEREEFVSNEGVPAIACTDWNRRCGWKRFGQWREVRGPGRECGQ